jgi:hypothetical protein
MTRILKAIAGGILIPPLLFFLALAADTSDMEWIEYAAVIPFTALVWPLSVFSQFFAPTPGCFSCFATLTLIGASVVVDFLLYGLLTYAALWMIERVNPTGPNVIELKL